MKTRVTLIGITLFCCLGLTLSATAAPPLADRLPGKTLFYAGWAGTQNLPFDGSMFGKLMNEPVMREIVATLEKAGRAHIPDKKAKQIFIHAWPLANIVASRPCALSWIDLNMNFQEKNPMPVISAVVLIDLGNKRQAFNRHLEAVLKLSGAPKFEDVTIGTVACKALPLPNGQRLSYGYIGDLFFIVTGQGVVKQLAEMTPAKSLQASRAFTTRMKVVSGNNEQFSYYMDVMGIRNQFESLLAMALRGKILMTPSQLLDTFGVGRLTAIAGSTRIVDKGFYSKTRMFTPAPHRGLLMLMAGAPLSESDLASIPADADFAYATNVSLADMYRETRRIIKAFSPDADAQASKAIAQIEQMVGVSLTRDILGNLGDTWVISSAPSQGGFMTGTVISVELKDARALAAALVKLEAFFKPMLAEYKVTFETVRAGRTEIRYAAMPMDKIPFPMPVAPAWAVHKNKLLISLWPQVVKASIVNDGKTSLAKTAEFRKWRSKVARNASTISYLNYPKIMRQTYSIPVMYWTLAANMIAGKTPVAAKPHWLPALSTLEKYTWPHTSGISSDTTGITVEQYSSIPLAGLITTPTSSIGTSALTVSILLPSLNKARGLAKRAVSSTNLNGIGKGIMMYCAEFDDKYPPNLATLVKHNLISAKGLVSPTSGNQPPKIDYVYLKPTKGLENINNPGGHILVYEKPEINDGEGTNVLFVDGSVRWMTMPAFRKALKRTRKATGRPARPQNREEAMKQAALEAQLKAIGAQQRAKQERIRKRKAHENEDF